MPKTDLKAKNRIAWGLGYPDYDTAILYLYFILEQPLPPIANAFEISVTTVKNRIVYHHKRKLRSKGGSKKGGQWNRTNVIRPIPVKKRRLQQLWETHGGGNSIYHQR